MDKDIEEVVDYCLNTSFKSYIIVFENDDSIQIKIRHDKRKYSILSDDELIDKYIEDNYPKICWNYQVIPLETIDTVVVDAF